MVLDRQDLPSSSPSFATAEVGGVDDANVSEDGFGDASEASPTLELATVVPFSEGEEGAVWERVAPACDFAGSWEEVVSAGVELPVAR